MKNNNSMWKFLTRAAVSTLAAITLSHAAHAQDARIPVVAAENFYGDVVQQLGGDRVDVTSILSNPDQDPHLFEASPKTARALQHASLVVYNGADYDPWMAKLLNASKNDKRKTIVAADLVGKKSGDNPHLWYDPSTMPAVAPTRSPRCAASTRMCPSRRRSRCSATCPTPSASTCATSASSLPR